MDALRRQREVVYPEGDGEPLGETDWHVDEMLDYVKAVLRLWFREQDDVYVAADNLIYWAEGKPKKWVSPDGYVVFGVPKKRRRVYKVWEEGGRTPSFVMEITSRKTRRKDLGSKMSIYRDDLHVPDYFVFDPLGDWVPANLQGWRLQGGVYQPIAPLVASGRLPSVELGLELGVDDGHVRFYEPGASDPLPTREEHAHAEAERARAAEAEVARLRAELSRLRGEKKGRERE